MTRVEPGFELVAEEFERNFGERGEHGAAFAAVADGELVVDLWGGTADQTRGAPWREDTVCLVFSGAKGLVATCLLLLIERGKLELDAPLSRYWPQFGNERVLVRHAVSHTAGLPGIRAPVALLDLLDYERMTSLLEAEEPYWEPGTRLAYHALTFGWLCGELVRRIDGRTVGTFFAGEVAGPLGLELWLGLPDEVEPRVARLRRAPDYRPSWGDEADPLVETVYENPGRVRPHRGRRLPARRVAGAARRLLVRDERAPRRGRRRARAAAPGRARPSRQLRRPRPGLAPVSEESRRTPTPLTSTSRTPVAKPPSRGAAIASGSKTTTSAA